MIVVSSELRMMVPVCHCHSKQYTLRIVLGFLKKLSDSRNFVSDMQQSWSVLKTKPWKYKSKTASLE